MGNHLLLEVYNVEYDLLNTLEPLLNVMTNGVETAGMTILNTSTHCFEPQGLTVVLTLSESHCSLHSWPEKGCAAIDVYTCGEGRPKIVVDELISYFKTDNYTLREINR
jgi:S-adenosylmethionine decarboxylase proenzyme